MHNLIVGIVYKGELELFEIIEDIKSMPSVIGVEWSESVQDIEYTDAIENLGEKSTMLPTN
jgi:hypothetical protein